HAEALVRTAASLSAHFDRDTLLKTICQETAGVLDMPVAAILLLDGNREQLVLAASVGLAPEIGEQAPPLPLAWFREQVGDQAREPYLVPDLLEEAQQYPLSEMLVQAGFRTLVLVELVYREQLVGILLASTLHKTRALDETDLKLVRG